MFGLVLRLGRDFGRIGDAGGVPRLAQARAGGPNFERGPVREQLSTCLQNREDGCNSRPGLIVFTRGLSFYRDNPSTQSFDPTTTATQVPKVMVYPLEVCDWLWDDLINGWPDRPRFRELDRSKMREEWKQKRGVVLGKFFGASGE